MKNGVNFVNLTTYNPLIPMDKRKFLDDNRWYAHKFKSDHLLQDCIYPAMDAYASHVLAEKESRIKELEKVSEWVKVEVLPNIGTPIEVITERRWSLAPC